MQIPIAYSTDFNNGYINMLKKHLGIANLDSDNLPPLLKEETYKISLEPAGANTNITSEHAPD